MTRGRSRATRRWRCWPATAAAVGLNQLARDLNVSRGHLSLVVHGKRKSKRLVDRLINECGFKPKDLFMVDHGPRRTRKAVSA